MNATRLAFLVVEVGIKSTILAGKTFLAVIFCDMRVVVWLTNVPSVAETFSSFPLFLKACQC